MYPVSILIADCHVRGGSPVDPPIPNTHCSGGCSTCDVSGCEGCNKCNPTALTPGTGQGQGGAGGGFVFGHISDLTSGSIKIVNSSAENLPSFGFYAWDINAKAASLELQNVTLTNTGTLTRYLCKPDGGGSPPLVFAPVATSNAVVTLTDVTVVDRIVATPRPWLQALSNCGHCGVPSGNATGPLNCVGPNNCPALCNGTVLRGSVRVDSANCTVNGSAYMQSLAQLSIACSDHELKTDLDVPAAACKGGRCFTEKIRSLATLSDV